MRCTHAIINGMPVIACGPRRYDVGRCGRPANRMCDWKTGLGRTCDKPLCDNCTHSPAPEKDLCPVHAAEWKKRLEARSTRGRSP